jgi:SAM-dependent methyltransferase
VSDLLPDLPRRFCPACGEWTAGHFRLGPGARPEARCPHCKSLERQRFLAVVVACLRPVLGPVGTVLDIAPAPVTTSVLGELEPRRHVRMDIGYDARCVDVQGSVCSIPLEDASVDLLVCYHVLEHVGDDARAMREIRRVLSPGGLGLVQVPIKFGFATDEDPSAGRLERVRRFGQADHVRYYGDDFEQRLVDAGLVFTRVSPRTLLGTRVCRLLGLIADEWVWVLRSSSDEDGGGVAPLVVPPPTGLTRTLDAVVDAWATDLARLDNSRERVRRLQTRTDRQARRLTQQGKRLARLRARLDAASGRPITLAGRIRARIPRRAGPSDRRA